MATDLLKLSLYSETNSGRIHRLIEVQPDEYHARYCVRVSDIITSNVGSQGLRSGNNAEAVTQSKRESNVTGVYKTIEEAKAEATAIFQKYVVDGWKETVDQQM